MVDVGPGMGAGQEHVVRGMKIRAVTQRLSAEGETTVPFRVVREQQAWHLHRAGLADAGPVPGRESIQLSMAGRIRGYPARDA
jgi:hypothetical protein